MIAAQQRLEHKPGDLVDIWYDQLNEDTFGWRRPAQVATVNDDEGNLTVRFQGRTLGRRQQEVRIRVLYFVYMWPLVADEEEDWSICRREIQNLIATFVTTGLVLQQSGWHVSPRTRTRDGRRPHSRRIAMGIVPISY